MSDAVNELLAGRGGRTASFKEHGDFVVGEVIRYDMFQQRDILTKELLAWPDGNPRMNIAISLQTEESEDEDDDGIRNLYVKVPSQSLTALREALNKVRVKGIAEGGVLQCTFVATAKPTKVGLSGQKQYEFAYTPPAVTHALPADGDIPYCAYHHEELVQSPRSGKWGHMVNGEPCFGQPIEGDSAIPF